MNQSWRIQYHLDQELQQLQVLEGLRDFHHSHAIAIIVDNSIVAQALVKGHSTNQVVDYLCGIIANWPVRITVAWVPSEENWADAPSRGPFTTRKKSNNWNFSQPSSGSRCASPQAPQHPFLSKLHAYTFGLQRVFPHFSIKKTKHRSSLRAIST